MNNNASTLKTRDQRLHNLGVQSNQDAVWKAEIVRVVREMENEIQRLKKVVQSLSVRSETISG